MERGLYIAAAGMRAESMRQDRIANDLANASTPGYKSDRAVQTSFNELLIKNAESGSPAGSLSTDLKVEITTDFSPEAARETSEPLDFAVEGDGFFAVKTSEGVRYTRNGQFGTSAAGQLVTSQGYLVLSKNGTPITVPDSRIVDPSTINVVSLANPTKLGDTLVGGTPQQGPTGTVRSKALENSGADPARSMIDMIASMRAFEAGQRVITTIDDSLAKSAGQLGSLGK